MKIFKSYKTIILSISDNQYVTSLNNIVYLESEKHYINYYLKNGDVIKVRGKLMELEHLKPKEEDADKLFNLGMHYFQVLKDYYSKAAKQSPAGAQYSLAICYYDGRGVA